MKALQDGGALVLRLELPETLAKDTMRLTAKKNVRKYVLPDCQAFKGREAHSTPIPVLITPHSPLKQTHADAHRLNLFLWSYWAISPSPPIADRAQGFITTPNMDSSSYHCH